MTATRQAPGVSQSGATVSIAWSITVALAVASNLLGPSASRFLQWMYWPIVVSVVLILVFWAPARPLRVYGGMVVLLTLLSTFWWNWAATWAYAQPWFSRLAPGYAARTMILELPKVAAALAMVAVLASVHYHRGEFFLVRGDLNARLEQPWLDASRHVRWAAVGSIFALLMGLAVFVYMWTTVVPSPGTMGRAALYLPAALLAAALNAFAEEMLYRGVLLGPLLRLTGPRQAILMTAVLFGISHYYGIPAGLLGVGLSFIAGCIFGRSMVDTRGLAWPWVMHFVADSVIFYFLAVQRVMATA